MDEPAETLRRRVTEVAGEFAQRDLVDALVANCARGIEWLIEQGVDIEPPTEEEGGRTVLAPVREFHDVNAWPGRGPQVALQVLQKRVRALGGQVISEARASEVIQRPDGSVAGVVLATGRTIDAAAVLLCDGGFQANPDLRREFIGPAADKLFLRGAPSGIGDGLRMGSSAGGQLINMQWFYGHCLHRGALTSDRLWPQPTVDDLLASSVLVNSEGLRITDEGLGGIAAANAVGRSSDPRGASIVLSEAAWDAALSREGGRRPTANPELERRGGVVHRAESAEDLAAKAGINAAGLQRTLDEFITAAGADKLGALAIPRSGRPAAIGGRLLGIPIVPGITFTVGGLRTDGSARVLNSNEAPIPGLYAAGGTAGGLQGGPRGGYVGGLAVALVFGLLAGESVAASRPAQHAEKP